MKIRSRFSKSISNEIDFMAEGLHRKHPPAWEISWRSQNISTWGKYILIYFLLIRIPNDSSLQPFGDWRYSKIIYWEIIWVGLWNWPTKFQAWKKILRFATLLLSQSPTQKSELLHDPNWDPSGPTLDPDDEFFKNAEYYAVVVVSCVSLWNDFNILNTKQV